MYCGFIKRFLDITVSAAGLILLFPLLLLLWAIVRAKLGKPVLFVQVRVGKNERLFRMYKFRSMTQERDGNGILLPDAERLTKLGRFLRATSLDELPELWNVLKGDMSLVGPRPLLDRYLPRYNETQKRRHEVRPGLTGYAQINGRNAVSWKERLAHDVWYVEHVGFMLDLKIMRGTVGVLFNRKQIANNAEIFMEEFMGGDE